MSNQEAEARILDGRMWNDFCDELKKVGEKIRQPETPDDVFNQALGYRYLTRMLRAGLESAVDYADPQYPAFFRLADDTKKLLNDNPDNYYENCVIDGRFDYRITGTRGTVQWLSLGSKAAAGDVSAMATTGNIDSTEMDISEDGRFEIIASQREQPGNWLPLTEASRMIIVRQTFGNRKREEIAQISIECLNPERENNNLVPADLEGQLQRALGFLNSTVSLGIGWMDDYLKTTLNGLPMHDQVPLQAAGGDPNITYYQSYWKLAPDEALIVTMPSIPECETWNLQLSDYWMESLDHRFFDVCVNKFTARYEEDGSVRIVIAHQDPGPDHPNWLNTLGYDQGGNLGRFVGCPNPPKEMATQVVKFSEL